MSKILVVEPHRMLQQAITLALFPEHEVKSVSEIPQPSELGYFDAVIVDGGSLVDIGKASATVQSWTLPTVWVESVPAAQAPRRERLVFLRPPVEKNALQSALAECLGGASKSKPSGTAAGSSKATEGGGESAIAEPELIELVDVVEEGADFGTRRTRQKKTK